MKLTITEKQIIKAPQRTLIYGKPGIGKTTFASNAPGCAFLPLEQGTNNVSVQRILVDGHAPETFPEVLGVLDALITERPKLAHLTVDTLSALEDIIHNEIRRTTGKAVQDIGYAKGYDLAVDMFRQVFARLEQVQRNGVGILLLAHAHVRDFKNPEGHDFEFYDIKLHKKASAAVTQWCDNVLFARSNVSTQKVKEDEKVIGSSSGERILQTQETPAFVAKNRLRMPITIPLSWASYAYYVDNFKPFDPKEAREDAKAIISAMDEDTAGKALAALAKVPDDENDLTAFIQFCKSKVKDTSK